jgi:hypothetical protein
MAQAELANLPPDRMAAQERGAFAQSDAGYGASSPRFFLEEESVLGFGRCVAKLLWDLAGNRAKLPMFVVGKGGGRDVFILSLSLCVCPCSLYSSSLISAIALRAVQEGLGGFLFLSIPDFVGRTDLPPRFPCPNRRCLSAGTRP